MPNFATLALIIFLAVLYGRSSRMGTFSMVLLHLPSTLLHELAHLIVGLLTFSGVSGFSLWPRREDGYWVLGSVQCSRLGWFGAIPVGLAPALLWVPLAWFAFQARTMPGYVWSFLLLTAAVPSAQDVEVACSNFAGLLFWGPVLFVGSALLWGAWWEWI